MPDYLEICAEIPHNGSWITYSRSTLVSRIISDAQPNDIDGNFLRLSSAYLANQESDLVISGLFNFSRVGP